MIICVALVIYGQTLGFGMIGFDDSSIITLNKELWNKPVDMERMFTTDTYIQSQGEYYRPITSLSYYAEPKLMGTTQTWAYHLTNILLFIVVALALRRIVRLFGATADIATAVALLFVAHPLFCGSVAWVASRDYLLMTAFAMWSTIFFIRFCRCRRWPEALLSVVCYTFAIFSKEATLALLPLFMLYFFMANTGSRRINMSMVSYAIGLLAATALFFVLRAVLGGVNIFNVFDNASLKLPNQIVVPDAMSVISNMKIIPDMLGRMVLPLDASLLSTYDWWKIAIGAGVILLLGWYVMKGAPRRTRSERAFLALWLVVAISPSLFVYHSSGDYMAHRFMLAAVGIFVILGDVLQKVCGENQRRLYMTTAVLVVVLGSATNLHALRYRDSKIFFRKETEAHPQNIYLQNLRVSNLMTAHTDFRAALELLNQEPLLSDTSYKTHFNRGLALLGLRRYGESILFFDKAEPLYKGGFVYENRGRARRMTNDNTGAIEDFSRALEFRRSPMILFQRGMVRYVLHDIDGASEDINEAIALDPKVDNAAYYYRGLIAARRGRYAEAITDFDRYIALTPKPVDALISRSEAKRLSGDLTGAQQDILRARRMSRIK